MFDCWKYASVPVSELLGKTCRAVEQTEDAIWFETEDGDSFVLAHAQDCCEVVGIEEIHGDLEDLVGSPILVAEESTEKCPERDYGVGMWTFYHFRTHKGTVTLRWFGESNGYYSVAVSLYRNRE